jgi:hypothetical protein
MDDLTEMIATYWALLSLAASTRAHIEGVGDHEEKTSGMRNAANWAMEKQAMVWIAQRN